ncbi:PREDICTED: RNA polymerase II C-terminal domain phosphatase-like 4 [Tarenaya hassleriana]|uniref:RNA polymerase II C-terminal domain phosphatase-like 4 n=1 Tax=Tarenaya hassleriana TaxID=28532 RepID=UPI00053C9D2D|nr:PREDICTED: RNA polymerase II C-terminal domain phosphatase-like 4 [Tarenaya hassleriana]
MSGSCCDHAIGRSGYCCRCDSEVDDHAVRDFHYLEKGLHLSHGFVNSLKRRRSGMGYGAKKLHLALDLNHTLVHCSRVYRLSPKERYLIRQADSRDDLCRSGDLLIKLRPFAREFLREANELFIMHICTDSEPEHAEIIVKFLDPLKIYFGQRVITGRDMFWLIAVRVSR